MKVSTILHKIGGTILSIIFALLLVLLGVLMLLYSPWAQDIARKAALAKFGSGSDLELRLDRFALRFPLTLELEGLEIITRGDTMASAGSAAINLDILPLLTGHVRISDATVRSLAYNMGGPDSAMELRLRADSIALSPATVTLGKIMDVNLERATLSRASMRLTLNTDTSAPTPPAPPTAMCFRLGDITLRQLDYSMRMMPTIDTLSALIPYARLKGGTVDLFNQEINIGTLRGRGLDARYIVPDSAIIAAFGPVPEVAPLPDSLQSPPWTIRIDSIGFNEATGLYTTAGYVPTPGLDFAYIQAGDMTLSITNFYNRLTTVRVPLSLTATERCGLTLDASGTLDIDSVAMVLRDFSVSTPAGTNIDFYALMGLGDLTTDPGLPVSLDATAAFEPTDLKSMFPAFTPYFAALPPGAPVQLRAIAEGTMGALEIDTLHLHLNHCVDLAAGGIVRSVMNPSDLSGHLDLTGRIINLDRAKNAFLDPATAKEINIPPMTLAGKVDMRRGGVIDGSLSARTGKGQLRMKALWNSVKEDYDASLSTTDFPMEAFMPLLGLSGLSTELDVKGHGYDPFVASTAVNAQADLRKAIYNGHTYSAISADATLSDGHALITLDSANPDLDLSLRAEGNLAGEVYNWTATLDGQNIDLQSLRLSETPLSIETRMNATAAIGPEGMQNIDASLNVQDLFVSTESGIISITDLITRVTATPDSLRATLDNRDLHAVFSSPAPVDSIMVHMDRFSAILQSQITNKYIKIDTLDQALPEFRFTLEGQSSNLINDILRPSDMSIRSIRMSAHNDSTLAMSGRILSFRSGDIKMDTLYLAGGAFRQKLHVIVGAGNRPGTMDALARVWLHLTVDGNEGQLYLRQKNIKGDIGFRLGLHAALRDSMLSVNVRPVNPIIGYQQWQANENNYINYYFPTGHLDADLHMTGGKSSLAIYTEGAEDHDHEESAEHSHEKQEDLIIKLSDIHIQDWVALNPFAPPMKGDLAADMRLNRSEDNFLAIGSAGISNFYYGRDKVDDMGVRFNAAADAGGRINAHATLLIAGKEVMQLSGAINDSTALSPLSMDLSIIHLPLEAANPFIPSTMARLSGTLNGTMDVSGTSERPMLNGWVNFDSTAVRLALTGTDYRFNDVKIPVENSVVKFKDFSIYGTNENPLTVNGSVDVSNPANAGVDLSLHADNMQLLNTKRLARGADVYGRAYISLDATARGNMSFMKVDADLDIMPGTNVTYVIPDATSELANYSNSGNLVKFVNFTDSLAMAEADSIQPSGMAMVLDAMLNIRDGSTINVDLSADGKNKVVLQSTGSLNYTMTPVTEGRLTGRLNLNSGFVRYTPPLMSEKLFNFQEGSYVAFTGNMMNPTLNIHAVDVVKANVTQEGQNSRLVNFDVDLGVTGTLENMNVAFDLSTDDDITVANELQTMSPSQRANQAMNLLLYNVYTGAGTHATSALNGNPLFSFLESQLNSWASNTIKGVDLSFGINQYDKTTDGSTSTTTSYSYQVSKSLFNDRFKIIVGGNYSTDANADENFSQNLISDISLEYFLNEQRTMYVRLFRHTGYESILEGEVTQTGVGFVYRRKILRLLDLFRPFHKTQHTTPDSTPTNSASAQDEK